MIRLALSIPLLFFALASAQAPDRDQRWRADLDALTARIAAVHPNPYTRTSPESFQQYVQQLRDQIPTVSDRQIVLGFSRILASLNDGHSAISLTQSGTGIRRYPIAYRWCSDGLFITTAPETKARLVGARVVAMNGKPVDAVYESIRPWISYDTESWYRFQTQTAFAFHDLLVAAEVMPDSAPLLLDVEAPGGLRFSDEIPLASATVVEGPIVSRPLIPLFRRLPNQDYWFEWIPEERTIYVQYNRCRENALLSIRSFANDLIAFAREHQPERWVIDVRENSGGNSVWFQQLLNTLGAAYASGQTPLPAKGAFGIIGKRTFSSGVLAVRDMQQAGILLVGETTGGRVSWFGENLPWALPNSRLSLTISTKLVGNPATGPEVSPDFPVEFTGADYFANRDPYLEKVLTLDANTLGPATRPPNQDRSSPR